MKLLSVQLLSGSTPLHRVFGTKRYFMAECEDENWERRKDMFHSRAVAHNYVFAA